MWLVLVLAAVVLLTTAAAFDWWARRRGDAERTGPDYWREASRARREERRAQSTRYFDRFLSKRPDAERRPPT